MKPRQAPWVTQAVKTFLRKKSQGYRKFMTDGQQNGRLPGIQSMISAGAKKIEDTKQNYFCKKGEHSANPGTPIKTYWSLIKNVLNKTKVLVIPSLLENGLFITNFIEKGQLFNEHFILQCTTIDTVSQIPLEITVIHSSIIDFNISEERILQIITSLNPKKAHGWDEISVRMIKLNDALLVLLSQKLCIS